MPAPGGRASATPALLFTHPFSPAVPGGPLLTSTHPRAGAILTPSGNRLLLMTQVSDGPPGEGGPCSVPESNLGKAAAAAADPNAAWAAYYSHYYQQPPGPVPGPAPAPAAPPAQGEPPQPPPTGQSDYTKAWEEYYKKIGQQPQQPGAPPQQDYTKAWEEYYKKQGEWPLCGDRGGDGPHLQPLTWLCPPTAQVATGGGPGAPPGSQPDYSAAWAEYYRQQAAYYGQTPGPGGPQPPPTQQGQQQASGNCHPPPPPFSFQPPATVHPALVGSAGNPFPCGVCP
ncbi:hypothetical protein P7K49_033080 [Saguinus oedipus]|uniref:Far upstream element-binding protein C-terminal domain-containing protein n=1 Tax=Saguinus oedipus TaxID=9490 RepID=A0ABQ9TS01_SAGOE|nr:hypothetical protein P7K49_033080 [Saguinus oedipus]